MHGAGQSEATLPKPRRTLEARKGQGKEEWSGLRIAPGNVLAHDGFSLTMALERMAGR